MSEKLLAGTQQTNTYADQLRADGLAATMLCPRCQARDVQRQAFIVDAANRAVCPVRIRARFEMRSSCQHSFSSHFASIVAAVRTIRRSHHTPEDAITCRPACRSNTQ